MLQMSLINTHRRNGIFVRNHSPKTNTRIQLSTILHRHMEIYADPHKQLYTQHIQANAKTIQNLHTNICVCVEAIFKVCSGEQCSDKHTSKELKQ